MTALPGTEAVQTHNRCEVLLGYTNDGKIQLEVDISLICRPTVCLQSIVDLDHFKQL